MEVYKSQKSSFIVILCAFFGSTERLRHKYAQVWVEIGASVLTFPNGLRKSSSSGPSVEGTSTLKERAKLILDTMITNRLDQQKVIIHIISEGGVSSWLCLMEVMEASKKYRHIIPHIVGYVLDSSPYHFGFMGAVRALTAGHGLIWRLSITLYLGVVTLLRRLISWIPYMTRIWPSLTAATQRNYRETLYSKYLGTLCQLYIWSTKDAICSPEYIQSWVNKRRAVHLKETGSIASIESFVVNDAPHVQILKLHPQEYSTKIKEFLSKLSIEAKP